MFRLAGVLVECGYAEVDVFPLVYALFDEFVGFLRRAVEVVRLVPCEEDTETSDWRDDLVQELCARHSRPSLL
ncbi:hypothetical protein D3C86_916620 [compost metagenome]